MDRDTLTRILCEDPGIRIYTVTTLNTVREIVRLNGTSPNGTVALGRVINGAALLSATLKPGSLQNLTLKFSGSGPAGEIMAQGDARGNLRGTMENPGVDLAEDIGAISFSRTIGAGMVTVTRDLGLREPYESVVPILNGEVAADLAYYLTVSEQVPSAVILGLEIDDEGKVASSGGILIQTFPGTDIEAVEEIEGRVTSLSPTLGERLRAGEDILTAVSEITGNRALQITGREDLRFACRCSRELLTGVLARVSAEDLKTMIHEDGGAEITCEFCKKRYHFMDQDLINILNNR